MVWKIIRLLRAYFYKPAPEPEPEPVAPAPAEPETPLYGMRLTPQQAERSYRSVDSMAVERIIVDFDQGSIDRNEAREALVEMIWVHAPRMSEMDVARLRRFVDYYLDQIVRGSLTISQAVSPLYRAMFRAWRGPDVLREYISNPNSTPHK